jgi:hypothetical protein
LNHGGELQPRAVGGIHCWRSLQRLKHCAGVVPRTTREPALIASRIVYPFLQSNGVEFMICEFRLGFGQALRKEGREGGPVVGGLLSALIR